MEVFGPQMKYFNNVQNVISLFILASDRIHSSYLGLILDSKLFWNSTLDDKSGESLYTCMRAIGLKWGKCRKTVRWLNTKTHSHEWWPVLNKKTLVFNEQLRGMEWCYTGLLYDIFIYTYGSKLETRTVGGVFSEDLYINFCINLCSSQK